MYENKTSNFLGGGGGEGELLTCLYPLTVQAFPLRE